MYISFIQFLPIYIVFFVVAVVERTLNTFHKCKVKTTQRIYYRWSFPLLFSTYLFIILSSIIEYITTVKYVNLKTSLLGFFVYFCAVCLRRQAIKDLGENWSIHVELKNQHEHVKHGIYSKMKHPYYLSVLLELSGVCLISNAYSSMILIVLIQLPLIFLRIRMEQKTLPIIISK